MLNIGRYLRDADARIAARAGRSAENLKYQIDAENERRRASRAKEIAGRSQNEKADILGAQLAEAARMQQTAEGYPSSPINLREVMQAAGLPGVGGSGKYRNKGTLQAPELSESDLRVLVANMDDGGQAMGAAVARGERPGVKELLLRGQQAIAQNMAAEGVKGQVSRGLAYAGITGGITASGAALIDLMQYLSQGAEVEGEREDVLSS